MITYFISNGRQVKIGKTERSTDIRIPQLQTGSSDTLELLGFIDGDEETKYHKLFHEHRGVGEWFHILSYFQKYRNEDYSRFEWVLNNVRSDYWASKEHDRVSEKFEEIGNLHCPTCGQYHNHMYPDGTRGSLKMKCENGHDWWITVYYHAGGNRLTIETREPELNKEMFLYEEIENV